MPVDQQVSDQLDRIETRLAELLARLDAAEARWGKMLAGPGAKLLKILGG